MIFFLYQFPFLNEHWEQLSVFVFFIFFVLKRYDAVRWCVCLHPRMAALLKIVLFHSSFFITEL
ncbi:hypothetical protein MIDIC_70026 [Alphaproteobacteria bacterium]